MANPTFTLTSTLTFVRTEDTLRVQDHQGVALVFKVGPSGRINQGYVIAPGYGMFSCWGPKYRDGVTLRQGKQLLRDFFRVLQRR